MGKDTNQLVQDIIKVLYFIAGFGFCYYIAWLEGLK